MGEQEKRIQELIQRLGSDSFSVADKAMWNIIRIGKSAVPALIEFVNNHREDFGAEEAVKALGWIEDVSAVPAVISVLKVGNSYSRQEAAEALGKLGDASAVPVLIEALNDKYFHVRSNSVVSLGQIGDVSAVPTLIDILRGNELRGEAKRALERIGKSATPALIDLLQDEEKEMRYDAALILGAIGSTSAIPTLTYVLKNEEILWNSAIEALGYIGDFSTVPVLMETMNRKHFEVPSANALKRVIKKCKNPSELIDLEDRLTASLGKLRKRCQDKREAKKAVLKVAELKMEIADRKNELAGKKDILLPDKPKPPKKGQMFNQLRRARNG
jgi:HEAT repeat protein